MSNKGGRNNNGRITVRFQGGGHKRRYRLIDFKRDKYEVPAKVVGIEYDPNRSANIDISHTPMARSDTSSHQPVSMRVTKSSHLIPLISSGNCLRLSAMPMGTVVHGIEMSR